MKTLDTHPSCCCGSWSSPAARGSALYRVSASEVTHEVLVARSHRLLISLIFLLDLSKGVRSAQAKPRSTTPTHTPILALLLRLGAALHFLLALPFLELESRVSQRQTFCIDVLGQAHLCYCLIVRHFKLLLRREQTARRFLLASLAGLFYGKEVRRLPTGLQYT